MLISEIIENLKEYHKGYGKIDDDTTRDKVLYGSLDKECTGIVTTCWPSVDVIESTHKKGANLIICHEALFWNHGDHTEWLNSEKNKMFLRKKALLDKYDITIWRNHDYIHSGIPVGDRYIDGIFYGFMKYIGWDKYQINNDNFFLCFDIPTRKVCDIANEIITKFNLNGAKIIGNIGMPVNKIAVCGHIMGENNELINQINDSDIDLIIALELIDYTVSEYIEDISEEFGDKAMLTVGHFNTEEPGMEYMLEYLAEAIKDDNKIPKYFIKSGDMYKYVINTR